MGCEYHMAKKKIDKEKEFEFDTPRKKYVKNYIILILIYAAMIALTVYICKWYQVYQDYEKEVPVIRGSLFEITPDDLDHYVVDTSSVIIYMCTANEDTCRSFEKNFKKYIVKNDVEDVVTYLNLTGQNNSVFVENFNRRFPYKVKLKGDYPAFVAFQDGAVTSILQGSETKPLTITKVNNFIELNVQAEENIVEEEKEEAE